MSEEVTKCRVSNALADIGVLPVGALPSEIPAENAPPPSATVRLGGRLAGRVCDPPSPELPMTVLFVGTALFFAAHSVPLVPGLRDRLIARLGVNGHKGLHTLLSAVGLGLMIWGYGLARAAGAPLLWEPPRGMRHLTALLALPVFPLLLAALVPGARAIRERVGHPMLTSVILWAAAHLVSVGVASAVAIMAAFFVWGVADRVSLARRAAARTAPPPAFSLGDATAIVAGLLLWGAFVLRLHLWLIGVAPLG